MTMLQGQEAVFTVHGSKKWSIEVYKGSKVITATNINGKLKCFAKGIGEAYIVVKNDTGSPEFASIKIKVEKPISDLSVTYNGKRIYNGGTTIPLIVDFKATFKVSTSNGWTVDSPNVGIIKRIYSDRETVSFQAINSNKRLGQNPKKGETYILIKEQYTGQSILIWVHVKPYVTYMKDPKFNNKNPLTGETDQIEVETGVEDYVGASGHGKITWTSSNTNVATVKVTKDHKGFVTFKNAGNVTITATYSDGLHKSVSGWVNYNVKIPPTKLRITRTSIDEIISFDRGEEHLIEGFTRKWWISSDYDWTYEVSNKGIISVTRKGCDLYFTGQKAGSTYLTIKENRTGRRENYYIWVKPKVTSVKIINIPNKFKVGKTYQLGAETYPENYVGKAKYGTIRWSSSNPKVASINEKTGKITIKEYGRTIITVRYSDGKHEVSSTPLSLHLYIPGIDVSYAQGKIDWYKVAQQKEFVMIRIGTRRIESRNIEIDSNFIENYNGAKKAGMKIGVYFYTEALNEKEAKEEAEWVVNLLKSYKLDYPVALDLESEDINSRISKNQITKNAKIFLDIIKNNGYTPLIYTNLNWQKNYIDLSQIKYDLWYSNPPYEDIGDCEKTRNRVPPKDKDYMMFQYSCNGRIQGINKIVDLNLCYKDYSKR